MPGGRGSAAVAKPPPVKQNNSLANGAQTCPLKAKGDCTLKSLTVTTKTVGRAPGASPFTPGKLGTPAMGPEVVRKLVTTKVKRNNKTTLRDYDVAGLLTRYDLVLDVICDAPTRDEPKPPGHTKIKVEAEYTGTCAVHTHPVVYEIPLDECPELPPGGSFWQAPASDEREFRAPQIWGDTVTSTSPFGFFIALLNQMAAGPKRIDVSAKGCGTQGLLWNDPDTVLNCLVRIFRKDKWGLKITIQPYKATSYTRAKTDVGWTTQAAPHGEGKTEGITDRTVRTNTTGGTTTTTTTSTTSSVYETSKAQAAKGDFGTLLPATTTTSENVTTKSLGSSQSLSRTTTTSAAGTEIRGIDRDIQADRNSEFVRTADGKPPKQAPGTAPWEKLADGWVRKSPMESPPPRVDLVLKRNGQELKLLEECRKFIEGLARVREMIMRFSELLKKAPQVGWSFGYTLSFFEGSAEASLEPFHMPNMVEDGRHWPISYKGKLEAEFIFITFSATASFGVKFDLGWLASAEATLNGTFKTEAKLGGEIEFLPTGDVAGEIMFKPSVSAEISGVLKASAAGVSLVEARVVVQGGVTIMDQKTRKSGGIGWKKGVGFCATGDVCTTDIVVKATFTSVAGSAQPVEHILLTPQKLWNLATP